VSEVGDCIVANKSRTSVSPAMKHSCLLTRHHQKT